MSVNTFFSGKAGQVYLVQEAVVAVRTLERKH
jgi:hypothetical protein